jgi:hypothetical protein
LGPRLGTPIWDPDLGPRLGNPIWDPDLRLLIGVHCPAALGGRDNKKADFRHFLNRVGTGCAMVYAGKYTVDVFSI